MSFYRTQLEEWLSSIDVNADMVLDIGGSANPVKGRTKSWDVEQYYIFDAETEKEYHEKWKEPDVVMDLCMSNIWERNETDSEDARLAYIAGLVDGEGYIGCPRSKKKKNYTYAPQLSINMLDHEGLEMLREVFDIDMHHRYQRKGKTYFSIQITGDRLIFVLESLLPYLRVKRRVAEEVLKMRKNMEKNRPMPLPGKGSMQKTSVLKSREIIFKEWRAWQDKVYKNADVMFCLELSEYLWSPVTAMRNLWYLLKPQGKLYITFCSIYPVHNPIEYDSFRYTRRWIEKVLPMVGFKIEKIFPRKATMGRDALLSFFSLEEMRSAKHTDVITDIGYMVEATK